MPTSTASLYLSPLVVYLYLDLPLFPSPALFLFPRLYLVSSFLLCTHTNSVSSHQAVCCCHADYCRTAALPFSLLLSLESLLRVTPLHVNDSTLFSSSVGRVCKCKSKCMLESRSILHPQPPPLLTPAL